MGYILERLTDMPALMLSYEEGFVFADEMEALNNKIFDLLEAEASPIYLIIDSENLKLSFNDIMAGIQQATRSSKPSFNHKNVKQLIVITQSRTFSAVVKGLNTVSFGNVNATVFESLDAALSHVREAA